MTEKLRDIPEKFPIPKELVDQISMSCEANGYGLMLLGDNNNGIHMILMGDGRMSPDEACVYMAYVLLERTVSGAAAHMNEELKRKLEEASVDKTKVN